MIDERLIDAFLYPILIFAGGIVISLVLRGVGYYILEKWARKTSNDVDDIIIASTKTASFFWCVIFGIYLAAGSSDLGTKYILFLNKVLSTLIIISFSLVGANLASSLLGFFDRKNIFPLQVTGLSQVLSKIIILAIGVLILLSNLGVSITPLITALGVGGLAVALALQDTLANFFAGIHILIEKPIQIGDFIKLESGEEGYVVDIGWRTTRVRMIPNNIVIIPNNILSQSKLINYYLPERKMTLLLKIGVSYDSDPEEIEKILVDETLKAADNVPGLLKEPPPFVRFMPGFMDSSLEFTLFCQVKEFVDQYLVQHELRKKIFKRFKEEGIEIPFPIRTIHMKGEKET